MNKFDRHLSDEWHHATAFGRPNFSLPHTYDKGIKQDPEFTAVLKGNAKLYIVRCINSIITSVQIAWRKHTYLGGNGHEN